MSQKITIPKECKMCGGTGSYKIPVSSPIMAPYGKDDTTTVPCECRFKQKLEPTISTILQEADKDFEDFYWETGKYNGRDLGIDGYKDFIHSQITKAYEAGRKDREIEFGKRIDDTIQFLNKLK